MASPKLTFGRHRGQTVDQLPDDYIRWLVEAASADPQPNVRPLPADIVEAALERMKSIDAAKLREDFGRLCMGGHPTGIDAPIFIIGCDGDCHSRSGAYAIDNQWFRSLDETLAYLASEFPVEEQEDIGGEKTTSRSTPDPEDDEIIVWEVLPSGHRRAVWGFFGWHFSGSSESYACGQGSLPGDDASLYDLAMREY